MSNRGWKALDGVGIETSEWFRMEKRAIHLVDKLNFQDGQKGIDLFYSQDSELGKNDLAEVCEQNFLNKKIWML
jgi:hypothetical protein